jgi:hypothetical protein
MIREGEPNVTLKYISESPSKLAISNFSDVQVQGLNIRHYHTYLLMRAKAYRDTRLDWVREGQGRLKRQTVDKGLLRETETVQSQIQALLKCDLLSNEVENEITLTAFRLITMDLLALFHLMNEGTINVLEHYFEMSKYDAERAFKIYKTFSTQTDQVVEFLSTARHYEHATRLEIPKLKHAPTSLTGSLEEYLNDPDFEINRRQYLAQQEAKKGSKFSSNRTAEPSKTNSKPALSKSETDKAFQDPKPAQTASSKPEPKGPAPDLIDFFDSIEQNQTTLATNPQQQNPNFQQAPFQKQSYQPQQSSFPSQVGQPQCQNTGLIGGNNPFGQPQQLQSIQPSFNGAGFGGYPQQPYDQAQIVASQTQNNAPQLDPQQAFAQQQGQISGYSQNGVNGFSQQQQPPCHTGQQSQSTNPFRQSMFLPNSSTTTSPSNNYSNSPSADQQSTNPFARDVTGQAYQNSPLQPAPPNQGMPFMSQFQIPNQATPFSSQPPSQSMQFVSPNQGTPFTSPPPAQPQSHQQQSQPLQPMRTGTNPFARNVSPPQSQQPNPPPLQPNPTGSTNPFRQSVFVNQQTGQGWQASQGTMGGLEQLPTIPVFPRPGQPPQQQQQQSPWS